MVAELTAPTQGFVKEIIIREGETIPVDTTILKIEEEDSSSGIAKQTEAYLRELSLELGEDEQLQMKGPHRIKAVLGELR